MNVKKSGKIAGISIAALALMALGTTASGDVAVSIDGGPGGAAASDSVHGWEFTVNQEVTVTHLGLWDEDGDGFGQQHPIGLYRLGDNTLLTSGTMPAGAGAPILDGFRYVEVVNATLVQGETYVISYYSGANSTDLVVTDGLNEVFAPEVNWVQGRWGTGSGGLVIPPNGTSADRYGPNFQFGGGGADYLLGVDMPEGCPGPITVAWDNAGDGQQGLVIGNNLGSQVIPGNYPCSGTVLGVAGSVMLVEPPGFFSTQGGSGQLRSVIRNQGVCGKYLQLVKGGTCETSNVERIE